MSLPSSRPHITADDVLSLGDPATRNQNQNQNNEQSLGGAREAPIRSIAADGEGHVQTQEEGSLVAGDTGEHCDKMELGPKKERRPGRHEEPSPHVEVTRHCSDPFVQQGNTRNDSESAAHSGNTKHHSGSSAHDHHGSMEPSWDMTEKRMIYDRAEDRRDMEERTVETWRDKIKQIKGILGDTRETSHSFLCLTQVKRHRVAIFSSSEQSNSIWLHNLLTNKHFDKDVKSVRYIGLSSAAGHGNISPFTFVILHSSLSQVDHDLTSLSGKPGMKGENVIVVFDDVEDNSKEEKRRILESHPKIRTLASDLILFTKEERDYLMRQMDEVCVRTQKTKDVPKQRDVSRTNEHQKHIGDARPWVSHGNRILPTSPKDKTIGKESFTPKKLGELNKHRIGIFSRAAKENYSWLKDLLESENFKNQDVRSFFISNSNGHEFKDTVSDCSLAILYHTKKHGRINVTDVTDSLYDENLNYMSSVLGKDNVMVLLDDLEDSSSKERSRILQDQPSIGRLAKDLILITAREKGDHALLLNSLESIKTLLSTSGNKKQRKKTATQKQDTTTYPVIGTSSTEYEGRVHSPSVYVPQEISASSEKTREKRKNKEMTTHKVSKTSKPITIFSRCGQSNYEWLKTLLESDEALKQYRPVQSFYISNSNQEEFREEVSRCKFGILYHTKKHGRLNITDVTDSLYDEELKYLSREKGKRKIIVVIDDVEDSGDKEKERIQKNQPSINDLAHDLILFSAVDKISSSTSEKCQRLKKLFRKSNLVL
ncbi:uncharacterized protein O3C94_018591 [Discoglossus pictus]